MSDHASDEETCVLDDVVVNKHKMAADITNVVLVEVMKLCVPGAKIFELCKFGDDRIQEEAAKLFKREKTMKKGPAFPTSISVNNIICHYAPISGEDNEIMTLKDEDLVKINLGAHIDGFAAVAGHTFVIGASKDRKVTGRKADVIQAAYTASEVAIRLIRPNNENTRLSEIISKALSDFNCHAVEGIQSHQMRRLVYDAEKTIVLQPSDDQNKTTEKVTFEVNEVWDVDICVSTGSGKPREHEARTTIYRKNETLYQLKMKISRQLHSEIASRFLDYPFNIRWALDDLCKARLGISECARHDVVQALPVLCEKDDELVAQFRFTVLLMPNGPMRITGIPFDSSLYKSEFRPRDPDVKEVLLQPIKNQGKKKKTAKSTVPDPSDKNGE